MASVEENKKKALRLFEAASTSNMDMLDDIMTEDFVTHGDALFPFFRGREGLKKGIMGFKNAFPNATLTVEEIFGEGNKVMAHVIVNGVQEKEWLGKPPTPKPMQWTATTIIRFNDDGLMAERWVIEDELGMMQQLGIMPRPNG